jgi:hypothetical protein
VVTRRSMWTALALLGCANIWGFEELNPPPPEPPPLVCAGYVEPCPTGCTACTSRCVDLNADSLNCGSCGTQCNSGRSCVEGVCVCGEGTEPCGGLCVDTSDDPMNCGACANACDPGGACNDGVCTFPEIVNTGTGTPGAIAVDADRIYFVWSTSILSIAKDGSDPVTLAPTVSASSIAIDATNLYYYSTVSIDSIPLGGGTPTMLAMPAASGTGAIAVDATDLYWVGSGSLSKVSLAGGTPLVLTTGTVGVNTIALDANYVYFAYSSTVYRTPLAGGSMTTVGSASTTVLDVAVDASSVYYAAGLIGAFAMDGSTNETLATASLPQRIATDTDSVYFFDGSSLSKVSKSGGDVSILAIDASPVDLAVDDTSVYWTSRGADGVSGAVMKVAK